ncbi:AMP-binding protein, partial [Acinetobacter baumannii]
IEHRIQLAQSKLVVTDTGNRSKLDEIENCPAIVTVADAQGTPLKAGDFNFWNEVKQQSDQCDLVMRSIQDPFLLMFTSGTTGPAK